MTDDLRSAALSIGVLVAAAPLVATPIVDKLRTTGLGILGTLRSDGAPRVSPVEVSLQDDELVIGMMPASRKLADVRRDPRVALLTPVADRTDLGGEGKLTGRLVELPREIADVALRRAGEQAGFDPEPLMGSPAFVLRVETAAWQAVDGEQWTTRSWSVGGGERHRRRVGAIDPAVDVPVG